MNPMLPGKLSKSYKFNVPLTVDAGYTTAMVDDVYAIDPMDLGGKKMKPMKMPKPGKAQKYPKIKMSPFEKQARKMK